MSLLVYLLAGLTLGMLVLCVFLILIALFLPLLPG